MLGLRGLQTVLIGFLILLWEMGAAGHKDSEVKLLLYKQNPLVIFLA